nr:NmrA family NAD(P)-binding protein [Actinomycetota bacterium]
MILVSGATGNVGGALVVVLAAAGQPVRALSRRSPEVRGGWTISAPNSLSCALAGWRSSTSTRPK